MAKQPFTARLDGEVIRRMRLLAEAEGTSAHDVLRDAAAAEIARFARACRRRGVPVPWDDDATPRAQASASTRSTSSPTDSPASSASSPTVSSPARRKRASRSR